MLISLLEWCNSLKIHTVFFCMLSKTKVKWDNLNKIWTMCVYPDLICSKELMLQSIRPMTNLVALYLSTGWIICTHSPQIAVSLDWFLSEEKANFKTFRWSHNICLRCNWCKILLREMFWNSNLFCFLDMFPSVNKSWCKLPIGGVSFEVVFLLFYIAIVKIDTLLLSNTSGQCDLKGFD